MKSHVHDLVRRLLELHALEDRLATFKRNRNDESDVETLIASLRGCLPHAVLIVHDRMRDHGRRSVAEVRHGVCSGCHIVVATGNAMALRHGELHRCGNCGRYLYIAAEDEKASTSANPRQSRDKTTTARSRPK